MTREVLQIIQENAFMLIYGLVLVLSLIKYKYYYDTRLKAFPILIAYILLTEIFGGLIRNIDEIQIVFEADYQNHNHLIYNILDIIFFLYFFYIYHGSTTNLKLKKHTKWAAILFCIAAVINPFFENFTIRPQLIVILTGSLALLFFATMYLKETSKIRIAFSNYHKLLQWVSIGILGFYPFYPFIIGIGQVNEELYNKMYLHKLLLVLITVMYGSFIIGLFRLGKIPSNTETKKVL